MNERGMENRFMDVANLAGIPHETANTTMRSRRARRNTTRRSPLRDSHSNYR
jgi:hypothetical protein